MDNQKAEYILQQIIDIARSNNNVLDLGRETADILSANGLIDSTIHDILTGRI